MLYTACLIATIFPLIWASKDGANTTYIYNDEGVAVSLIKHFRHRLEPMKCIIKEINAQELSSGQWLRDAHRLIIPGGRDLPYLKKIKDQALENIFKFVEGGGYLLGVCAGAYFLSARVEFEIGTAYKVIGDRPLAFYPKTAYGAAFGPYTYNSATDNMAKIIVDEEEGVADCVLYSGGCYFLEKEVESVGWRVFARYEDGGLPAIITKDRIVLSCVHIEYDPSINKVHTSVDKAILDFYDEESPPRPLPQEH